MKKILGLCLIALPFFSCDKNDEPESKPCDIEQAYKDNEKKATITNGIWGTLAYLSGNCMPIIDPTTCTTCPQKKRIKIYALTNVTQATPQNMGGVYDSFSTNLITEVQTDNNGFFQTTIPAGQYTIAVVQDGKLHTFGFNTSGDISPFTVTGGKQKLNLTLNYKVVF
jgi:hypothetical protein